MKKMPMTKTVIYSFLTVYFFAEMFWPLSTYPQWLIEMAFGTCLVLYLDNLLTGWRATHEPKARG